MKQSLFLISLLLCSHFSTAQVLFETDYTEPSLPFAFAVDTSVYGLSHFSPSEMKISCATVENAYDVFAQPLYVIENGNELSVDVSGNGIMTIIARSDSPAILRADLVDTAGVETSLTPKTFFLTGNGQADTIEFIFSGEDFNRFAISPPYQVVDSTAIFSIAFMVNPGGIPFNGNVYIDNLRLGESTTRLQTFSLKQKLEIYPNPTQSYIQGRLHLENTAKVQHQLFDLQGRKVLDTGEKRLQTGEHAIEIATGNLTMGIYYFHTIIDGKYQQSKKVVVQ